MDKRLRPQVVEFAHLHKYSFKPGFRVHLGLRVVNDTFEACALNGPTQNSGFDFTSAEASVETCADRIRLALPRQWL